MGIDTSEVLEEAGTKWNFLNFSPGLVGGHCIGVDPYYLAQGAQEFGYHPEIILAGRRLNDGMGAFVAKEVVKLMLKNKITVLNAKILILGFTFKENCPDVRNTRVIDIYQELLDYDAEICIYDPWVSEEEVRAEYGIDVKKDIKDQRMYDAIILAVGHKEFLTLDLDSLKKPNSIIYDVKGVLPKKSVSARL